MVVLRPVASEAVSVDPCRIATKLVDDAVDVCRGALRFHGKAYSVSRCFHCPTRRRARRFSFRSLESVPVQVSRKFRDFTDLGNVISERSHAGKIVRVTTLERVLVDVLDAPGKGGGWEKTWRSLLTVSFSLLSGADNFV